ncbi:hypothetical protein [Marinobacter sediminum]|uniref:hypothetical protein n=1 Tax=Marinobacter sediminum TaxID=256323 RepID=UPI00356A16C3
MNRFKKEETRSPKTTLDNRISELARSIHAEWFPEEYDHFYDSIADASDRRTGINPMSAEYTQRVNERRRKLGVTALAENGMPTSNDSWKLAHKEARKRVMSDSSTIFT